MSTLAPTALSVRAQRGRERGRSRVPQTLFDDLGGEPTLDELIAGVWEGLAAQRSTRCPVCEAEMQPVYGAHALQPDDSATAGMSEAGRRAGRTPEGGCCTGCGTALH
ncbi:MAG: hypothetical protein ACLPTJ_14575 [Solirubrobacteraceae bacterium]